MPPLGNSWIAAMTKIDVYAYGVSNCPYRRLSMGGGNRQPEGNSYSDTGTRAQTMAPSDFVPPVPLNPKA